MTARARLRNRRASVTFTLWCNSLLYTATVSYFANGDLAEIFLQNVKAGIHSDAAAKDSAVVCSIALQYGVPVDRFHQSQKNEAMMEHLLSAFVTNSTRLLDPTCGSGVAIKIAKRLGAHSALGLELDEEFRGAGAGGAAIGTGEVEMSKDPLDRPTSPEACSSPT